MEKAYDDALIVYAQNGEMLRPEQGYPVRLINPGWEGNTCVKWLRRSRSGTSPGITARRHRSTRTCCPAASPGVHLRTGGQLRYHLPLPGEAAVETRQAVGRGLAWSGRGRIKHVDVSVDGGVTWREARFTSAVEPRALTRFGIEWEWNGNPALLQSRAVDETGYVQPTYGQLRAARGSSSIYHKNAIHTWKLSNDGSVRNVQIFLSAPPSACWRPSRSPALSLAAEPGHFGYGSVATPEQIAGWDIDVRPDGTGCPRRGFRGGRRVALRREVRALATAPSASPSKATRRSPGVRGRLRTRGRRRPSAATGLT